MRDPERKSIPRAKTLRRALTRAETILWSRLRPRIFPALRFRRQHPIGPYIADFACPAAKLVVEVDGETHSTQEEQQHDARRTAYMQARGWRVLRVTNENVTKHIDDLLEAIMRFAPPPRPMAGPPP